MFNWSTGKDSALALHHVLQSEKYHIRTLVTNINKDVRRVSMHGLSEDLLDAQAEALDLPLHKIYFSGNVSMKVYSNSIISEVKHLRDNGVTHSIYGDIFLEDLKDFREDLHQNLDVDLVYPLWKNNTTILIEEFIELGFKAILVCINASKLDQSFLGRTIDHDFIKDLPDSVDPCGENGEFHSFVYDGPIFKHPVKFIEGEKVLKTYNSSSADLDSWDNFFWYLDLKRE